MLIRVGRLCTPAKAPKVNSTVFISCDTRGRAVVADPKSFLCIAEEFGSMFPDRVVGEDVKDLYDAVDGDADQHEARRVGKDRPDGWHGPVVAVRLIEEPGLTD